MKPKQAYNILTALYGCVKDKKRDEIGEINLLNTIIRNIGKDYFPSEKELKMVSIHLESERKRIDNGELHVGSIVTYGGAVIFLIIMYIPVHFIIAIANKFVGLEFPFSYVLGFFVAIAAPIYIVSSGPIEKHLFSAFDKVNHLYLTKKINRLTIIFNEKTNK